jgi:predicted metallo-beta-lactamase superfamily hydrolase
LRISHYNYDYVGLEFSHEEIEAMLNKDEDKLNDLAELFQKYDTWINDCKKIRTKEILQRARA